MPMDVSHLVRKAEAGSPPRIALPSDAGLVSGVAFLFLIDRAFEKTCPRSTLEASPIQSNPV
jgi:hypothetical protein